MLDQTTYEKESLLELRLGKEEMRNLHYVAYWGIAYIYRGEEVPEEMKTLIKKIYECIKAGE